LSPTMTRVGALIVFIHASELHPCMARMTRMHDSFFAPLQAARQTL
jgi:hypothetical protein